MSSRIAWIDIARGLAIIAVVVFHAALKLRSVEGAGLWEPLVLMLETFRMPAFFFVSGLVSASVLTRPSRTIWIHRIAFFAYLYVLWAVLQTVILAATNGGLTSKMWLELSGLLVRPHDSLWFLYALVVFTAFVWAMRTTPAWVPLATSFAVSILFLSNLVLTGPVTFIPMPWMKLGSYTFFFVVGVYMRSWVLDHAARVGALSAVALIGAYVVIAPAWYVTPVRDLAITRGLVSVLGVAAGLALAVLLARARGFRWLEHLGRNTLPIYVLHLLVIVPTVRVLEAAGYMAGRVEALALAPLLAAVSIVVSLAAYRALRRVPGLFTAPWLPVRAKVPSTR